MRRLTLAAFLGGAAFMFPASSLANDIPTSSSPYSCDGDEAYCNPAVHGLDVIDWAAVRGVVSVAAPVQSAHDGDGDNDGDTSDANVAGSAVASAAPSTYSAAPSGVVGCILQRESNNGATSSNLAQFQQSTWDAYGGQQYAASPGAASRADQIAMVNHVIAVGGIGNWSPYDGC
jgi:hypothetical protein